MSAVLRAVVVAASLSLAACSTTVECPAVPGSAARDAVVVDHGRTTSLVIETSDRSLVRYAYGDRRWYAEGDTGLRQGFAALFRPTPATLFREPLAAMPETLPSERSYRLRVAADRADALIRRLDALWHEGDGDPATGFADHPVPYTLGHNSNQRIAAWLAELGCEVGRPGPFARWTVH